MKESARVSTDAMVLFASAAHRHGVRRRKPPEHPRMPCTVNRPAGLVGPTLGRDLSDSGLTRHKSLVCVTLGKDATL